MQHRQRGRQRRHRQHRQRQLYQKRGNERPAAVAPSRLLALRLRVCGLTPRVAMPPRRCWLLHEPLQRCSLVRITT